jgi:universal stress protein A
MATPSTVTPLFRRILCPVDFSSTSQAALKFAAGMSGQLKCELILLHVFELMNSANVVTHNVLENLETKHQLEQLSVEQAYGNVIRMMHSGVPGKTICQTAIDHSCDLIVMGTHGRSGLKHLLMGSVAEYVLRNSACPVLVLRA